jgi:DNA-binding PadR family transcriptional regulator
MQNVNGRDRKYYLLTEKGKKQQATQEAEMKSYLFNLNAIFNI